MPPKAYRRREVFDRISYPFARPSKEYPPQPPPAESRHCDSVPGYPEREKAASEERLNGKNPAEALLDMMEDSGYYGYCVAHSDRMTKLFFAHFKSIELAQAFPEVLLIDCTYRTNIYNMPLLHFAGVTPTGENFSIGFALLSAENTFQYGSFQGHCTR